MFATHAESELETVIQHYCVPRDGKEPLINGSDLRDGWVFMKCWLQAITEEKVCEEVKEPIEVKKEKNADPDPFSEDGSSLGKSSNKLKQVRSRFKITKKWRYLTVAEACSKFIRDHAASTVDMHRAWVALCVVYVVWILATADCERGFSLLKNIKTAQRNRLVRVLLFSCSSVTVMLMMMLLVIFFEHF